MATAPPELGPRPDSFTIDAISDDECQECNLKRTNDYYTAFDRQVITRFGNDKATWLSLSLSHQLQSEGRQRHPICGIAALACFVREYELPTT